MRINITPSQLRAVVAVADGRSFTAASAKLGLSQPALSRIVRAVEAELGCTIFDRDTRNVSPTFVGEALLPIIRNTLINYEEALSNLSDHALGRSGIVRVVTLPSLAQALLVPAMIQMRDVAPGIELQIYDGLSDTVISKVIDGEVDIGLVDRPMGNSALTYHDLVHDQVGLVCRSDDPLAQIKRPDWTVFATRPFISMAVGSSVRNLIDAAFLQAHLSIKPLYEPAFLATVGALVATHAGITALPKLAAQGLQQEGIIWRPLHNPTIIRSSGCILRSDREPQPAIAVLLDLLKKAV